MRERTKEKEKEKERERDRESTLIHLDEPQCFLVCGKEEKKTKGGIEKTRNRQGSRVNK